MFSAVRRGITHAAHRSLDVSLIGVVAGIVTSATEVAFALFGGVVTANWQSGGHFADRCTLGHLYLLFLRVRLDARRPCRLPITAFAALIAAASLPVLLKTPFATCDH